MPREGCDRVALHFHGNAEVCGEADDIAPVFHAAGFALVSVDYRGYGWSTAASRGLDDFREMWGGNTTSNRHRRAW